MNSLYIVPTPIGNIEEVTKRAMKIFSEKSYFLCEDTRITTKLFDLLKIDKKNKKFISYHKFNENSKVQKILKILNDNDVVLVSDAGAPTVNDPGHIIVKACIQNNVNIIPVSGPSSLINMIMGSGINIDKFAYIGFIPKKKREIEKLFSTQLKSNNKIMFLLSVHQYESTLKIINELYPKSFLSIGKELTKKYETFFYGTPSEIIEQNKNPKGEYIGIIEININNNIDEKVLITEINKLKKLLNSNKDIQNEMLKKYPNIKKNYLYRLINI